MRAAVVVMISLALTGSAMAQSQNAAKTGAGGPLESLEALQSEWNKQYAGLPGQAFKGAVGIYGLARALAAASDAVNFKLRVRGNGSVDQGGGATSTTGTSVSTDSTTSSSTSTN